MMEFMEFMEVLFYLFGFMAAMTIIGNLIDKIKIRKITRSQLIINEKKVRLSDGELLFRTVNCPGTEYDPQPSVKCHYFRTKDGTYYLLRFTYFGVGDPVLEAYEIGEDKAKYEAKMQSEKLYSKLFTNYSG